MSSGTTDNASNGTDADAGPDADGKAQTAAAIEDLQDRLREAEQAADDYQKQSSILQTRLDDAHGDHATLEQSVHELHEQVEHLTTQQRETIRQRREFEGAHEADLAVAIKDKEELEARQEELLSAIKRLKEGAIHRDLRAGTEGISRPSLSRNRRFEHYTTSAHQLTPLSKHS